MRLSILITALLWAGTVSADTVAPPLPALYQVTGVSSDDVLNIRTAPRPDAAIIGTLAPAADGIEVTSLSKEGNWARINVVEATGWVAYRFLTPAPGARLPSGLPVGLRCSGVEPFWDITFGPDDTLRVATPTGEATHPVTRIAPAPDLVDLAASGALITWDKGGEVVTSRILPGQCSDGMSDRAYGLHYVDDQGLRTGCCSLR